MRKALVKAGLSTTAAIILSNGICAAMIASTGGQMTLFSVATSTLCPLLLAFPLSSYLFNQNSRLKAAHSALSAAHAVLADRVRIDDLTGLLNRTALATAVHSSYKQPHRGTLLLIDFNNVKSIHDKFGPIAGDEAMRCLAGHIMSAFGDTSMKARIGDDEFGVFLPGQDVDAAGVLTERFRGIIEVAEFYPAIGKPTRLTVRIGVIPISPEALFTDLLQTADINLDNARKVCRNTTILAANTPTRQAESQP